MKFAAFQYRESCNLGDEIQSIAAMQFLPNVDYYIDRDHMYEYKSEEQIKMIFNGWFMAKPENWPPPKNITPLFISFHINTANNTQHYLLSPESIEYFKQHEPIGCRDYNTMNLLLKHGVNAYFSGCLTLTLQNNYETRNETTYFVDALYNINNQRRNEILKKIVPEDILRRGVFLKQTNQNITDDHRKKMEEANLLLIQYSQAKLVVTSRIHTALPCLALNTPVIFINYGFDSVDDYSRFDGLIGLFRTIDKNSIEKYAKSFSFTNIFGRSTKRNDKIAEINWNSPQPNPVNIQFLAKKMRSQCRRFIES